MPQQALALANSELAVTQARSLAKKLSDEVRSDDEFVTASFRRILARDPKRAEREVCLDFLNARTKDSTVTKAVNTEKAADPILRARENLLLVLLNHNDFITIR